MTTSESTTINTTNAEIKGTLTSQEIQDKPVFNQSNFLTLAETFTGFQENPTSGQNNPTASSGSSINFNGTGTRGATFQINGVNNDDSSENQNRQGAALSTIKEFQVITNNFTAEFGRGYGAVVLVQTKSGTNNIHGDVYWFHNDSALNAKSFLAHGKKPVNRRNQFGFTSGFPIFRNKLFGFVSLDHKEETGANTYTRDVFLAAERNPANWFTVTPANDTPANRAFIQSIIDRIPAELVPNDPRSTRTFVGQQPFDFPARDYSGRLDWNPFQSDNLSARWQYTRQRFDADDIILGERADQNNKQQNFGLTWTHLFSNTTVGEFRYGLGLRTTLVNITAGNDTPIVRFENPVSIGATIIGNAGQFPIQRYQTDNQFVYNLTTLFGNKHFFKAGTDIRRQKLDDLADSNSRASGNSIAPVTAPLICMPAGSRRSSMAVWPSSRKGMDLSSWKIELTRRTFTQRTIGRFAAILRLTWDSVTSTFQRPRRLPAASIMALTPTTITGSRASALPGVPSLRAEYSAPCSAHQATPRSAAAMGFIMAESFNQCSRNPEQRFGSIRRMRSSTTARVRPPRFRTDQIN